jgi:hypothetical protein
MLARVFLPMPGRERSKDVEIRQHKASAGGGSKIPDIASKALYSSDDPASAARDVSGPAWELRQKPLCKGIIRDCMPVKHAGVY